MIPPIVNVCAPAENGNNGMGVRGQMKPPSKRETRNQFSGVAERYRLSADHGDSDDREILLSRLSLGPSHLLLDVATGGGHTAAAFSPKVPTSRSLRRFGMICGKPAAALG